MNSYGFNQTDEPTPITRPGDAGLDSYSCPGLVNVMMVPNIPPVPSAFSLSHLVPAWGGGYTKTTNESAVMGLPL